MRSKLKRLARKKRNASKNRRPKRRTVRKGRNEVKFVIMIFLICLLWVANANSKCFDWGTYKPHLMYHYLERDGAQFVLNTLYLGFDVSKASIKDSIDLEVYGERILFYLPFVGF